MNVNVYTRCDCLAMRSPAFSGLLFGERHRYMELLALEAIRDSNLPEMLLAKWQADHVRIVVHDLTSHRRVPLRVMTMMAVIALEAILTIVFILRP